ncbi:hypothetical protein M3576_01250 [Weizmannia ginsengihumi]|nr:surface carbohydrate biosynthesis protein [Heyndrickxia ginsengihumi]MCM3021984.1 hypothetical protein [Heyndrickxia ginsengihumi]
MIQLLQKFLYLPIEAKTREMDAKLLLTYYAIKQHYHVILGGHTPIFSHLNRMPKGILFSKGTPYGDSRKELMADAKHLGYTPVELDEEGLLVNGLHYDRLGKDDKYLSVLEHVYCWGYTQKEIIVNQFPNHEHKLYITGHPRFDLLKKKFRSLYDDEVKKLKDQYGDFILVNTRFTQYNHFLKGLNPNEKYIKTVLEKFIDLVKKLSMKYPNLNIVVRPHIHEGLDIYRRELANFKNVFIVHEGNIAMWLMAAKVVIHNRCTTGIEAFLLDKPVIAYIPINYKRESTFLPNAVTKNTDKIKEIFDYIDAKHLHEKKDEQKKLLAHYYGALDENYAYENIIQLLDRLSVKAENPISDETIKALATIKGEHTLTSEAEIKSFFKKLDAIEGTENKFRLNVLAPDLFEISALTE